MNSLNVNRVSGSAPEARSHVETAVRTRRAPLERPVEVWDVFPAQSVHDGSDQVLNTIHALLSRPIAPADPFGGSGRAAIAATSARASGQGDGSSGQPRCNHRRDPVSCMAV